MAGGQLGGEGTVVEIDESIFYRRKYNVGRLPARWEDGWVFGMIERGTNKVIMQRVPRRNAATLIPIIQQHVRPGTRIISDGWAAYGGIAALQQAYDHDTVIHDRYFVDPNDPSIHTQSIEGTWGAIKSKMRPLMGTSQALFSTYLYNYMWRRFHNRRNMFQHLWQHISVDCDVPN